MYLGGEARGDSIGANVTQHVNLDYLSVAHEGFFDAIQELLSAAAPHFGLFVLNATTVRLLAGTGDDQQSLSVDGRYRWRSTNFDRAHPGGAAGTYDVFVTATDNDFTGAPADIDAATDYSFGLDIQASGSTPSTPLHRKVAEVDWDGAGITALRQTVGDRDDTAMLTPTADQSFLVPLEARGAAGQTAPLFRARTSTLADRVTISNAGQLALPVTGATGGLLLGGDVNVYRLAANLLSTDDSLAISSTAVSPLAGAAQGIYLNTTGGQDWVGVNATTSLLRVYGGVGLTNPHLVVRSDGRLTWGDGTAQDTVLYRSAADVLKTDDAFEALRVRVSSPDSAATPGHSWLGDADTGMYNPAADTLVFATAATQRFRVSSTGQFMFGASTSQTFPLEHQAIAGLAQGGVGLGHGRLVSTDAVGVDVGYGLLLGGASAAAGTLTSFAAIRGAKENVTDANTAGNLTFFTRVAAGNLTERMRITSTGDVIFTAGANVVRFIDTTAADNVFTRTMSGWELVVGTQGTANKYGRPMKWMTQDADFTTETPKFLAYIVQRATEGYTADTAGGSALDFGVTPNAPGATNIPVQGMTLLPAGLSLGTAQPTTISARLLFPQGTTVADGIQFGTDANNVKLYRSANNTLKTDDIFETQRFESVSTTGSVAASFRAIQPAAQNVITNRLLTADAQGVWSILGSGEFQWGAGGASVRDTNLYRISAGVLATDNTFRVRMNGNGINALTRTMRGLELSATEMDATTQKYDSAIKWMSTDAQLTTENPKFLAGIVGRATEAYSANTSGGMGIDFAVTANAPGTASVPAVAMSLLPGGLVLGSSIPTTTPARLLLPQGTTVADGIQFGTDANAVTLYRAGNDLLQTEDQLRFVVATTALSVVATGDTGGPRLELYPGLVQLGPQSEDIGIIGGLGMDTTAEGHSGYPEFPVGPPGGPMPYSFYMDWPLVAPGFTIGGSGGAFVAEKAAGSATHANFTGFGDTQPAFQILGSGEHQWGPGGSTAPDTTLYRPGANVLKTDDSFHVGADLRHLGSGLGFYGVAAVAKPTLTGSRAGNAAVASIASALATLGLATDSTTA